MSTAVFETPVSMNAQTTGFGSIVCLALKISGFTNTREAEMEWVHVDADKSRLSLRKKLLQSPELEAIKSLDGAFRKRLTSVYALPSPLGATGTYMLKVTSVSDVEQEISDFMIERENLLNVLEPVYPQRCAESAGALRVLYNSKEFPPFKKLRKKFNVKYTFFSFGAPPALQSINPEYFHEAQKRIDTLVQEAQENARIIVREKYREVMAHLVDRLKYGADGKPQIFRNSMIENANAFFDAFHNLDLTDDTDLAQMIQQSREIIKDVTADTLRSNATVREIVCQGAEQLIQQFDQGMVIKPGRALDFEV